MLDAGAVRLADPRAIVLDHEVDRLGGVVAVIVRNADMDQRRTVLTENGELALRDRVVVVLAIGIVAVDGVVDLVVLDEGHDAVVVDGEDEHGDLAGIKLDVACIQAWDFRFHIADDGVRIDLVQEDRQLVTEHGDGGVGLLVLDGEVAFVDALGGEVILDRLAALARRDHEQLERMLVLAVIDSIASRGAVLQLAEDGIARRGIVRVLFIEHAAGLIGAEAGDHLLLGDPAVVQGILIIRQNEAGVRHLVGGVIRGASRVGLGLIV